MSEIDLPVGWAHAPLSELLLRIESGKSFKCEERPPIGDEVGVVKVSAVTWGEYREAESKTCTEAGRVNPALFVQPGDFLFSRANTIDLVGACVIAGKVTQRVMLSDKILRLHFIDDRLKPWLLQFVRSQDGRKQIEELSTGNQESMRNIGQGRIGQIQVPLPPETERERIVEKLEELLSDLDAGVAELKAAQRKLAQYRQSLLKAAVEGALSADWRTVHGKQQETGGELLQRNLSERRARWEQKQLAKFAEQDKTPLKGWQAKYPEPVAPSVTELPELPEGWVWASVDQCAIDEDGITDGPFGSNLKSEHYTESGARVIRLQNIGDGRFQDARAYISEDRYERLQKHAVVEGDVVVAMLGEVLPRACTVPVGVAPAIVKADCARVRPNRELLPSEFLMAALNSEPTRKRVNRLVKGIGRPRVNLGNVRSIPIPLPSRAEQLQILTVLSDALESCDNENVAIDRGLSLLGAQRKNLLKAAFTGRLVPQDPNDEPASELLSRIRAERASNNGDAPRRRRKTA